MTKQLMLGTALAALMLSGALAQAPTDPNAGPPTASKSEAAATTTGQGTTQGSSNAQVVASQNPDQWLASNFKGTDVVGSDNAKIGNVTDILFDKHGKIEAYVVSVGGFLGMGSKSVAIAPNSFDVVPGSNGSADKLKLSMTKDQLKEAQNFQPYEAPRPTTTGSAPGNRPMGVGMKPPGTMR
jgi:sporulation protein YlmC with PRC-barrel domain